MEERVLEGDPPLSLTLRRSSRAKRFSLRVSRSDGRVTLTLPSRAAEAEGLAFARSKLGWIRAVQRTMPQGNRVSFGQPFPYEGRELLLTPAALRVPRIEGERLLMPEGAAPGRILSAWLRHGARERMSAASDAYAARLGRRVAGLSIRDTRSRWGSCSGEGRLMYSWRLMMAPPEIADYVAAHEVAHLVEMNHSPAFWGVVRGLMADYAPRRDWLRRHGPGLQAWQFGDKA